uniref:Uncharacterized protein n=1 Tax=Anguilla anguilla TaxID=7936 RepID=A0A0E9PG48_ANGAN
MCFAAVATVCLKGLLP